jgi:hypothetical protein
MIAQCAVEAKVIAESDCPQGHCMTESSVHCRSLLSVESWGVHGPDDHVV